MVKIVIDMENKEIEMIELGEHSLDLSYLREEIQKVIETIKTKEDAYAQLGIWEFQLPNELQEEIIVYVEE
jgi:hypothetical protein